MKTDPQAKALENEELDNPEDPSVTPVEPRCRRCGQTFSTEEELMEHAKTCKGGHDSTVHEHQR